MKKLKVIQIGALHDHASMTMESLRRQSDIFEVLGYAIPEGEGQLAPQVYEGVPRYSVEEALALPGLDAVIVETSELNSTKYALMAAKMGYPVHMDKPGGVVLKDFEELIATVKATGKVFHTGYMYRYNPEIKKLMRDIEEGKLGQVYAVEAHMDCIHYPEKRQWLGDFPGGMLFFLGCHLIDLIYRIMGEPEKVLPLSCCTGADGVTAQDYGMCVLQYPNGVSFAKSCATEPGGFARRQLVVCGSRGTVELNPIEMYRPGLPNDMLYTGVRRALGEYIPWGEYGERYDSEMFNRYDGMMAAFASYVRGDAVNPYDLDYELRLYKLLLRCCGSEQE